MTEARTPRPWRLRGRLGRAFTTLAILLALLSAVLIVATIRFAAAGSDLIYRKQPAGSTSVRLLADLVNQETGVRGYVLIRQSAALQPYRDYRKQERIDHANMVGYLGDDAGAKARLAAFDKAAQSWQDKIAVPAIEAVRSGAKPSLDALDDGTHRFDAVRAASGTLLEYLRAKVKDEREARTVDGYLAGVSLGLALVILAAAGAVLWRGLGTWVLGPVERLGVQTRTVASGDLEHQIVTDGPLELTDLGADVEAMRAQLVEELAKAEYVADALRRQGVELERSNADLQQFAYVASHDLSEPLRKVANFCQLLERQYGPHLDDRARQYIDFAVDGAKRMQTLIGDLLELSRVGRSTEGFVPVDLDRVLVDVTANLADVIAAAGARVEQAGPLPTLPGDRTLLTSLLENLIGNAIKYRRPDVAPVVSVDAEQDGAEWTIAVTDNGIGIDAQYAERIFAVFQRLHLRDQYGGTGIGLALCRKIVEFHGGRIWLDHVASSRGATFRFTLPESSAHAPSVAHRRS